MNFQDTLQAIEISVLGGRTPYLVGHAGIGKSNIGKEFCEKYENVRLVTLFGSLIKEGELGGIPVPKETEDGTVINTYTMHTKMKEIWDNHKEGYATLLFVDEINRSDIQTQQELMQLILDKKINETELPDDVMIIAAGNPENSEYGDYQVNVMNDALKDRFIWLEMEPEVEEWLKWANRKKKVEGEEMTMVHEDVINFIATNPELLHVPNTDEDVKATPRSWEAVSDVIRSNEDLGNPEHLTYPVIKGTVGSSASVAFRQFIEEKQNPMIKVEEIINKKGLTEEIKDKLYEETMPRISVLSNRVVRHLDKAPRMESWMKDAFYEYLNAIPKDSMVGVISDIMRNYTDSIYEKLFNEERFLDLFHEADARTEGF